MWPYIWYMFLIQIQILSSSNPSWKMAFSNHSIVCWWTYLYLYSKCIRCFLNLDHNDIINISLQDVDEWYLTSEELKYPLDTTLIYNVQCIPRGFFVMKCCNLPFVVPTLTQPASSTFASVSDFLLSAEMTFNKPQRVGVFQLAVSCLWPD